MPPSPRADVLPEASAAPLAEVRPEVVPLLLGAAAESVDCCMAFFSSSGGYSSGTWIWSPLGLEGWGDYSEVLPSVIIKIRQTITIIKFATII